MPDPTSADPVSVIHSAAPGWTDHQVAHYPHGVGYVPFCAQCWSELSRLRAELADWRHGSDHEAEEADSLRARLEQTEAVVKAVRKWHRDHDTLEAWLATEDALRALPEAPPVAAGSGE